MFGNTFRLKRRRQEIPAVTVDNAQLWPDSHQALATSKNWLKKTLRMSENVHKRSILTIKSWSFFQPKSLDLYLSAQREYFYQLWVLLVSLLFDQLGQAPIHPWPQCAQAQYKMDALLNLDMFFFAGGWRKWNYQSFGRITSTWHIAYDVRWPPLKLTKSSHPALSGDVMRRFFFQNVRPAHWTRLKETMKWGCLKHNEHIRAIISAILPSGVRKWVMRCGLRAHWTSTQGGGEFGPSPHHCIHKSSWLLIEWCRSEQWSWLW